MQNTPASGFSRKKATSARAMLPQAVIREYGAVEFPVGAVKFAAGLPVAADDIDDDGDKVVRAVLEGRWLED